LADGIAVEAVGLGKQYRRTLGLRAGAWALRDCSFALPAGRVAALVGANGAGKTTLLSIVAGLLAPSEGSALVGGSELGGTLRSAPEAASRVAFVAQEKPLYRHFTAADMLRTGAHLNRVWDHQRALGWLRDFDVPLDRPCGKLSGGQQAQVSFAVALGSCPSVLLLDEPLSNLDPLARREVTKALLAAAADTGLTVLLSTHVVAELGGVADYLLLLAKGRLLVEADVDELLAAHVHYVGPRSDSHPGPGEVVAASHAERQSSFLVRLPAGAPPPAMEPPWTTRPVTLEDLVLAHLRASKESVA
jgi:ABC-2 type transport system ATP-binding protein